MAKSNTVGLASMTRPTRESAALCWKQPGRGASHFTSHAWGRRVPISVQPVAQRAVVPPTYIFASVGRRCQRDCEAFPETSTQVFLGGESDNLSTVHFIRFIFNLKAGTFGASADCRFRLLPAYHHLQVLSLFLVRPCGIELSSASPICRRSLLLSIILFGKLFPI
jgi:hypothetical protein